MGQSEHMEAIPVDSDQRPNIEIPTAGPREARVTVRFDEQQYQLLEFLRQEERWGTEDGEIIRRIVLEQVADMQRGDQR